MAVGAQARSAAPSGIDAAAATVSAIHVHLDAVGGAAGDMFVAAMLDARPDLAGRVLADVAAVLPDGLRAVLGNGVNAGIAGARFTLEGTTGAARPVHYGAFVTLIRAAELGPGTAAGALAILSRIGEAEARIHAVPLERVHFHEIADWDTVMDVVAAGSIVATLGAGWSVSPLPLGGGTVRAAHGLLPVPAPATAMILTGYDWHDDGVGGERVTPTGAAILAHVTGGTGNGRRPGGRLASIGTGLGARTLDGVPNMLRATVFEATADASGAASQRTALMTFEVDDMTGEEIATAADRLRAQEGVRDVVLIAASGKKGRPLSRFEVQADPAAADAVADAVFAQTSTLGMRRAVIMRDVLPRHREAKAGWRVKHAVRPGGVITTKVEQDDVAGIDTLAARRDAAREAEQ